MTIAGIHMYLLSLEQLSYQYNWMLTKVVSFLIPIIQLTQNTRMIGLANLVSVSSTIAWYFIKTVLRIRVFQFGKVKKIGL